MRVLVTGITGRFGPYLARELERAGHELVLFSRREPPSEFNHLQWVKGDINVFEDCERVVEGGFDAIHHAAAMAWASDHPDSRERVEEQGIPFDATMQTNIMGTYYLLQAALAKDVGIFVMTGSNCVLGHGMRISERPFPYSYLPIDEKHPSDVEDSYSFSKLSGELLLDSYTRAYGIRTYALRAAGICPMERRKNIAKHAGQPQTWDTWMWTWVGSEDLALAHRLLMEKAHDIEPHGVFYCNGDDTTTLVPSMELIETLNPDLLPLARQDELEGHASFFSNKKLRQAVGWEPRTSWRKHLQEKEG